MRIKHITTVLPMLVVGGLTVSRPAAAGPSNLPIMSGNTNPSAARSNAMFNYVVTQTDQDTDAQNNKFTDTKCSITIGAIRAFQAYRWTMNLQGVDANGTYSWLASGPAIIVNAPTDAWDDFTLYNQRVTGDIYLDPNLAIRHLTTISP